MEGSGKKFTEGQRNNINKNSFDTDNILRSSKPHLKIDPQEMKERRKKLYFKR